MRSSRFGIKSLFNILYATIILLPMFAVFGRLIYTQSNPNAKDSYTGTYKFQQQISLNDLTNPFTTKSNWITNTGNNNYSYTDTLYFNELYINSYSADSNYIFAFNILDGTKIDNLTINSDTLSLIVNVRVTDSKITIVQNTFLLSENTNFLTNGYTGTSIGNNLNAIILVADSTIYTNFNSGSQPSNFLRHMYINTYIITTDLSNAFEYSLQSFTQDNNLGNVNLFGWFTDLFLNQSNPKNAVYLNFINWYMNYTLLVSSGYLIFLALIWFINYIRKILDKSMYHDFGGF